MPTNPVQTAKRSVSGDHDDQDESQLEQELCRLQRQLHAMEGDRRAYSEDTCNLLRKQKYIRNDFIEITKIYSFLQGT